jgi:hypothetical protein
LYKPEFESTVFANFLDAESCCGSNDGDLEKSEKLDAGAEEEYVVGVEDPDLRPGGVPTGSWLMNRGATGDFLCSGGEFLSLALLAEVDSLGINTSRAANGVEGSLVTESSPA